MALLRAARNLVFLNMFSMTFNLTSVHMYILVKVSTKLVENCTFSGYLSNAAAILAAILDFRRLRYEEKMPTYFFVN